jgi:AmmeMemoRadiSam system protein B
MPESHPLIRPSAIAGRWYPGNPEILRLDIERYFSAAPLRSSTGRIYGLVAPHAGYSYSGPTAGRAFAQIRGADIHRVVLLGPLHRPVRGARLAPFMIPREAAYRTPLGDVPVDHAFLKSLGERIPLGEVAGDEEHALEIELPFLQVALGNFAVAPIMLGEHIAEQGATQRARSLVAALAALVDPRTLLVASTDLSHMEAYEAVIRTDSQLVDLVAAFDVEGVEDALARETVQACGATGLSVVLHVCRALGAKGAEVLRYTSSGDVTGDRRPGVYTVGYMAAVIHG